MKRILLIALLISPIVVEGTPIQQKADPFAVVPPSQGERLKSRLAEFVEYHRTNQWDKVYDLIAERDKNSVEGGLPRDVFLKKKLYSRIRKFTPKSVQKMDDNWWMMWGCGNFDRGGVIEIGVVSCLH